MNVFPELDLERLSQTLPIQEVSPSWLKGMPVSLHVLRLDLTDLNISGNKWFKLAHNIRAAERHGTRQLLTFGGAFSNHVYSFAHACYEAKIQSVAVIRGEELDAQSNPMLKAVSQLGTKLIFVDREEYRNKYQQDRLDLYRSQVGEFELIPEGGSNVLGVKGAEVIADLIQRDNEGFDHIYMACGTGATFAGLVRGFLNQSSSANHRARLQGLSMFRPNSVVPKEGWLDKEVVNFIGQRSSLYELVADRRLPGYGKLTPDLMSFCNEFLEETGILLDPVYTVKLMRYLKYLAEDGVFSEFEEPKRILAVHTGGLHGWLGFLDSGVSEGGGSIPAQLLGTIKQRLAS